MRLAHLVLSLIWLISACASREESLPEKSGIPFVKEAVTRDYENLATEKLFRAGLRVIQDQGFAIKTMDERAGVLVGLLMKPERINQFVARIPGEKSHRKGELIELCLYYYSGEKKKVRVRASLQRMIPHALGGQEGYEVREALFYQDLFDWIGREASGNLPAKPAPSPSASPTPLMTPEPNPTPTPAVSATPSPTPTATPSLESPSPLAPPEETPKP